MFLLWAYGTCKQFGLEYWTKEVLYVRKGTFIILGFIIFICFWIPPGNDSLLLLRGDLINENKLLQ